MHAHMSGEVGRVARGRSTRIAPAAAGAMLGAIAAFSVLLVALADRA